MAQRPDESVPLRPAHDDDPRARREDARTLGPAPAPRDVEHEAGFSAELTHHAYHALDSHVTGFTLWQVNLPFSSAEELVGLARGFLEELPAERYPYVVEHIHQHLDPASPDGATEFEFGLDLILDGLERLRDAG